MYLDTSRTLDLSYDLVKKYLNLFVYLELRIIHDYKDGKVTLPENKTLLQTLEDLCNAKDVDVLTDILSDLYPRGILYDNIIWSFEYYDEIVFWLQCDTKRNIARLLKKKQKRN